MVKEVLLELESVAEGFGLLLDDGGCSSLRCGLYILQGRYLVSCFARRYMSDGMLH